LRRFHNDELHNLYSSPNIVGMIKSRLMGGTCSMRNAYNFWLSNLKGSLLERPVQRLQDQIKMDLKQKEWESANRIHLAQDRHHWQALVNTVMSLWVP
jgi:hypothetical protein